MIFPTQPPKNLVACTPAHICLLCEAMRTDERHQYEALTGLDYESNTAAARFIGKSGQAATLVLPDGLPGAAGGFEPIGPDVWQAWMLGSEAGWEHWRSISKGIRWLMGALIGAGARRLQGACLSERTAACRWLEHGLGMEYEGTWRRFGANGEDLAYFAWVKED